jgi:hypothetical protein
MAHKLIAKTDANQNALLKRTLAYAPLKGVLKYSGSDRRGELVRTRVTTGGYLELVFEGRAYYAHRLAWFLKTGKWPRSPMTFKNGEKTDIRFSNLICVSPRELLYTRRFARRQKLRATPIGVTWHEGRQRYRSRFTNASGEEIWLGQFDSVDDARAAYEKAI